MVAPIEREERMSRSPKYGEAMIMHSVRLPHGLYAKVQQEAARETLRQGKYISASDLVRRALEVLVEFKDESRGRELIKLPG